MSEHPLTLFLGLSGEEHDPRALLDAGEGALTRHDVLAALRSRLAQVAAHARGQSPEASEVRLLLHAAAARLLAGASAERDARRPEGVENEPASDPHSSIDGTALEEFQSAALLTLGMLGGWNRNSLHRLKLLAISRGVPPEQIAGTIRSLTQRPWGAARAPTLDRAHRRAGLEDGLGGAAPRPQDHVPAVEHAHEQVEHDHVRTLLRNGLIVAGLAVIALTAVGVALFVTTQQRRGATPSGAGTSSQESTSANGTAAANNPSLRSRTTADEGESSDAPSTPRRTPAQLIASLRDASLQVGPASEVALVNFERDIDELSVRWTDLGAPELSSAVDAVIEFTYRAVLRPETGQRTAEILTGGAQRFASAKTWDGPRVERAVWCGGILARLLRERDLPPGVRGEFESRWREMLGSGLPPVKGGFEDGVGLVLARLPEFMVGGEPPVSIESGAWEAYSRCASRGLARDRSQRERLLLALAERLMLVAREPQEDATVREGIRAAVQGVDFSILGVGRERVIAWLGRDDLSIADLATVTGVLIEGDRYKELDITMALSAGASELERLELRTRYESVWGGSGSGTPRALVQKWIERARGEVKQILESPAQGPLERLANATRLSTLNAGAARVFSGDASTLEDLVGSQQIGVAVIHANAREWDSTSRDTQSSWAARYWTAGYDIPRRREMLAQSPGQPNGAEAAILVRESIRGVPQSVRMDARKAISRSATDTAVIHAMLDFAPFIPPTKESTRLLEDSLGVRLPAPRSPSWRVELRRVLVLRMIELVGGGESGFIDLASEHLGRQCEDAASALAGPDAPLSAADSPSESAALLRAALAEQARRVVLSPAGVPTPAQALARLGESRRRVEGDVQRYVIEQDAAVELLAALCASERPESVVLVRAALDAWEEQRGRCGHVFDQIEVNERAAISMWIIRLGGEP